MEIENMKDRIFSPEELAVIFKSSEIHDYTDKNVFRFGFEKTTIIKQDLKTRLILAQGNKVTGYEHIIDRHFGSEIKPYWKDGERNPTVFTGSIIPWQILEYALKIYDGRFERPGQPESEFQLFEGPIVFPPDKIPSNTRLLVYKAFPIIHTFYISDSKKKNRIKTKGYIRGLYSSMEDSDGNREYKCPFYESPNSLSFIFVVVINVSSKSYSVGIHIPKSDNIIAVPTDFGEVYSLYVEKVMQHFPISFFYNLPYNSLEKSAIEIYKEL